MICPKCGGNFHLNESCQKCRTAYSEVIEGIRHDEMKKLFLKIEDLMKHHRNFDIEESLLACELINSSLLIPLIITDDQVTVKTVEDYKKRRFMLLFTDKEEYDKNVTDIPPTTNPFWAILDLLEDGIEGFVINSGGVGCELTRKFLNRFFLEDLPDDGIS